MKYENIEKGIFISRPNRFIAHVEIGGREEVVHVKNTGRCKELLTPGAMVYCARSDNPFRKTAYDLIAVQKAERLINMDSQAPNKVFYEWASSGNFLEKIDVIRPEYKWGKSRFDFYIEWQPTPVFLLGESPWTEEPHGLQSMEAAENWTRLK